LVNPTGYKIIDATIEPRPIRGEEDSVIFIALLDITDSFKDARV
jgi:hypothetical protein